MSKSYGNTVPILASPGDLRRSVASIITDSRAVHEPKEPAGDVLFELFSLVADPADATALADHYRAGGVRDADVKGQLTEMLLDRFAGPRATYDELMSDPAAIDRVLASGAERARETTARTLRAVRRAIGLTAGAA